MFVSYWKSNRDRNTEHVIFVIFLLCRIHWTQCLFNDYRKLQKLRYELDQHCLNLVTFIHLSKSQSSYDTRIFLKKTSSKPIHWEKVGSSVFSHQECRQEFNKFQYSSIRLLTNVATCRVTSNHQMQTIQFFT